MKYGFVSCILFFCLHVSTVFSVAVAKTPISMHNYTSGDVAMALHYLDSNENTWITFGWLSIPAYTSITKRLPTTAKELYFYAVNDNGKVYEGAEYDTRDKKFIVSDAPFIIREGQRPEKGNISFRYFRHKKAVKGSFTFKF